MSIDLYTAIVIVRGLLKYMSPVSPDGNTIRGCSVTFHITNSLIFLKNTRDFPDMCICGNG